MAIAWSADSLEIMEEISDSVLFSLPTLHSRSLFAITMAVSKTCTIMHSSHLTDCFSDDSTLVFIVFNSKFSAFKLVMILFEQFVHILIQPVDDRTTVAVANYFVDAFQLWTCRRIKWCKFVIVNLASAGQT